MTIIDEIRKLDVDARLVLLEEIWASIAEEERSLGLSEEEREVLDARLEAMRKEPENLLSWSEIKHKIKNDGC